MTATATFASASKWTLASWKSGNVKMGLVVNYQYLINDGPHFSYTVKEALNTSFNVMPWTWMIVFPMPK